MMAEKYPWYKNGYVWLVIFLPLSAVIGGIITIRLAIISDDGLVSDDYYQEGLQINRLLERDKKAEKLGLSTTINFDYPEKKVKVLVSAKPEFSYPEKLKLSFLHRTRKGFDKVVTLKHINDSLYEASLPKLVKGNWYVQIETDDWRVLKSMTIR